MKGECSSGMPISLLHFGFNQFIYLPFSIKMLLRHLLTAVPPSAIMLLRVKFFSVSTDLLCKTPSGQKYIPRSINVHDRTEKVIFSKHHISTYVSKNKIDSAEVRTRDLQ